MVAAAAAAAELITGAIACGGGDCTRAAVAGLPKALETMSIWEITGAVGFARTSTMRAFLAEAAPADLRGRAPR